MFERGSPFQALSIDDLNAELTDLCQNKVRLESEYHRLENSSPFISGPQKSHSKRQLSEMRRRLE